MAANKHEDSELSRLLDRLNLQESPPSMPAYDDLYPPKWANNEELEKRHLDLMLKIKKWPRNGENEVKLIWDALIPKTRPNHPLSSSTATCCC